MESIKIESTYKGTRILLGNDKRDLINDMISIMKDYSYTEILIPIIQYQEIFASKVGVENNNLMFNFKDRGNRDICLSPEYTAVIQKLGDEYFKNRKDIKIFYVSECFRGEKPQASRYRQFTQFGVEVLNPTKDYFNEMIEISTKLVSLKTKNFELKTNVTRGLDYYMENSGFEISCDSLGSSKQICGGGRYSNGIGFALGIDRILDI